MDKFERIIAKTSILELIRTYWKEIEIIYSKNDNKVNLQFIGI